eukprot:7788150-Alexandrium_andersonii.AAC.1
MRASVPLCLCAANLCVHARVTHSRQQEGYMHPGPSQDPIRHPIEGTEGKDGAGGGQSKPGERWNC